MNIKKIIETYFPQLSSTNLVEEIVQHGMIKSFKSNEYVLEHGRIIKYIPLLFEGKLKVSKVDEEENELFLYYLFPGNGCAMSFACFDKMSSIKVQAEEKAKIIAVPTRFMEQWMMQYPEWNRFVLRAYNQRFDEVLETLNEVAFHRLDERLLNYLHKQGVASDSNEIITTHAQIAQELNSSREVISRLLKKMESNGYIKLERNKITILD